MTGTSRCAEAMYPIEAVARSGITHSTYGHLSQSSDERVHVHFCPRC
jgi:hypothetical protein